MVLGGKSNSRVIDGYLSASIEEIVGKIERVSYAELCVFSVVVFFKTRIECENNVPVLSLFLFVKQQSKQK